MAYGLMNTFHGQGMLFFSYKNLMQNDPQLAIRECTLVRRQNTNNDQETKSKFMYTVTVH